MKAALRPVSALCAVSFLSILVGCDEGSSASGPVVTSVQTQDSTGAVTDDFASGQQVSFVLKVHNTSEYPVIFDAPSCAEQASYVVVKQGTANQVTEGAGPAAVCPASANSTPVTIPSGQTDSFTFTWNQMVTGNQLVQPGKYSVVAGLVCVDSGYCMPDFGTPISSGYLTQSLFRSSPTNFSIKQ